jgi:hypothetical protein
MNAKCNERTTSALWNRHLHDENHLVPFHPLDRLVRMHQPSCTSSSSQRRVCLSKSSSMRTVCSLKERGNGYSRQDTVLLNKEDIRVTFSSRRGNRPPSFSSRHPTAALIEATSYLLVLYSRGGVVQVY